MLPAALGALATGTLVVNIPARLLICLHTAKRGEESNRSGVEWCAAVAQNIDARGCPASLQDGLLRNGLNTLKLGRAS